MDLPVVSVLEDEVELVVVVEVVVAKLEKFGIIENR